MSSDTVRAVLDRCGTTCAEGAGLRLADGQAALFQLLVAPPRGPRSTAPAAPACPATHSA